MTSFPSDPPDPTRDDLLAHVAAMQGRLVNLAAIEQAKGALMVTYGLTADEAFELLRFHSQTRNVKLRAIAAQLTARLSSTPTSSRAITQFDRLIDDVTRSLQNPAGPAVEALAQGPPLDMASPWSRIAADRDTEAAQRGVPTVPPGITIAGNTPEHPLVYANDAFAELTGYPIGDVLGRNCRFLQGAGTDPRHIVSLSRALHTGREVSLVIQNYRSDGSAFLNKVSISPIRNPAMQITHFVGSQIDVTQRITRPTVGLMTTDH